MASAHGVYDSASGQIPQDQQYGGETSSDCSTPRRRNRRNSRGSVAEQLRAVRPRIDDASVISASTTNSQFMETFREYCYREAAERRRARQLRELRRELAFNRMATMQSEFRFDSLRRDYLQYSEDARSSEGIHNTELHSMLRNMKTELEARDQSMRDLQDEKNKLEQEDRIPDGAPLLFPCPRRDRERESRPRF